jgi:hypothetical protein
MNKENKIQINTGGNTALTYSIYYTDYSTLGQGIKTPLYAGKAYNINSGSTIDIYVNDIIKNIPRTVGVYNIIESNYNFGNTNRIANVSYNVLETSLSASTLFYLDYTKYYYEGADIVDEIIEASNNGYIYLMTPTFNKLNKFEDNTDTQIAVQVAGRFDNDEKQWGFKFGYTDGTNATYNMGTAVIQANTSMIITVKQDYLYSINPQPAKTVKEVYLVYDVTGIKEVQTVKMAEFATDDCKKNIISYEGRNGSINYLRLSGNTIYSENINRYKKLDLFDKETIYANLVDETITINTGWLTDIEAKGLEDLFVSKKVFLFDVTLGKYLAVNVEDSSYTQRLFKNEKHLKNYTITLKLQQKELV